MNVRSRQSGGVGAFEGGFHKTRQIEFLTRDVRSGGAADEDLGSLESGNDSQTVRETFTFRANDDRGIRGERVGVDRGDEDRGGFRVNGGDFAVRTGAERGPETALNQFVNDVLTGDGGEFGRVVFRESKFFFFAVNFNDDRHEGAPLSAIDGFDRTSGRRGEKHTGIFHVGEKRLANFDLIANLNRHGGAQSHVIRSNQRDFTDRFRAMNLLFRRTGKRKVKAFSNRKFLHS